MNTNIYAPLRFPYTVTADNEPLLVSDVKGAISGLAVSGGNLIVTTQSGLGTTTHSSITLPSGMGGGLDQTAVDARITTLVDPIALDSSSTTWPVAKIPNLSATKITSGTLDIARIPYTRLTQEAYDALTPVTGHFYGVPE